MNLILNWMNFSQNTVKRITKVSLMLTMMTFAWLDATRSLRDYRMLTVADESFLTSDVSHCMVWIT